MFITSHPKLSFFWESISSNEIADYSSWIRVLLLRNAFESRFVNAFEFPSAFRIPNERRISARTQHRSHEKKNLPSSLGTITRHAIRQRSSALVNPFKAARARLYVATSRKKGAVTPVANSLSSPPFVSMPASHFPSFPSPLSPPFSFLSAIFSRARLSRVDPFSLRETEEKL